MKYNLNIPCLNNPIDSYSCMHKALYLIIALPIELIHSDKISIKMYEIYKILRFSKQGKSFWTIRKFSESAVILTDIKIYIISEIFQKTIGIKFLKLSLIDTFYHDKIKYYKNKNLNFFKLFFIFKKLQQPIKQKVWA